MTYKAVLFHPEGDHVTDFTNRKTKKDVWYELAEMGSRWFFYPIVFVVSEKGRVVDIPNNCPQWFKRKSIKTVQKYLSVEWNDRRDEISTEFNAGYTLSDIYWNAELQ